MKTRLVGVTVLAIIVLLLLLPRHAETFSSPVVSPREFVTEVLVPWYDRTRYIRGPPETAPLAQLADYPDWQKAALAYERILGVPTRIFLEKLRHMVFECDLMDTEFEDWFEEYLVEEQYRVFHLMSEEMQLWAEVNKPEDIYVEGGNFDPAAVYAQITQRYIRQQKVNILKLLANSAILEAPPEIESMARNELLDSNIHDEAFQVCLATMINDHEKKKLIEYGGFLSDWYRLKQLCGGVYWFHCLSDLRREAYFPGDKFRNDALQKVLEDIFADRNSLKAAQRHLVKHLDSYQAETKLVHQLYNISLAMRWRDSHCNEFLTENAMSLQPRDLIPQEEDALLARCTV